jgi:phosphate-selective porin OprO/OprP
MIGSSLGRSAVALGAALAVLGGAALAPAQESAEEKEKMREMEMKSIKERLEFLEGKTKGFPDPAGKEPPVGTFFKDGLKWKSADGNFDGYLGGRFLFHGRWNFDRSESGGQGASDQFFVRQARIETGGTFYKDYEYKVQVDFPTGAAAISGTMQDGYIGWKKYKEFSLRMGQQKEPFSQEETTSTRFIDFVERSLVNRLAPGRDIGIAAYGQFMEGVLEYEAGVYNGAGRAVNDNNDEKDVAGRIRVTPMKTSDSRWWKNLRFGVAGTVGDQDGVASTVAASRVNTFGDITSTETGTRIVDFDGASVRDGDLTRIGFELSWLVGPWGFRSEWIKQDTDGREQLAAGAQPVEAEVEAIGHYLALTYLLTGEDKPLENRIKPATPFDPSAGKWGAFELAARIATLDVHGVETNGFGVPGTGGNHRTQAVTLGVNWWLTSNFRCTVNYVLNEFGTDNNFPAGAANAIDDEKALLTRVQIDF